LTVYYLNHTSHLETAFCVTLRYPVNDILHFVTLTVIQLSDVHSSRIYLAVLFPHNCYPIHSLAL